MRCACIPALWPGISPSRVELPGDAASVRFGRQRIYAVKPPAAQDVLPDARSVA